MTTQDLSEGIDLPVAAERPDLDVVCKRPKIRADPPFIVRHGLWSIWHRH